MGGFNVKKTGKPHEIDASNDIKYRGPLNYQHLRVIAWALLALAQFPIITDALSRILGEGNFSANGTAVEIIRAIGSLALPLLLIANFAVILGTGANYKKLLIKFGSLSGGVAVLALLLYERYLVGILSAGSSRAQAKATLTDMFAESGFLAFNLFLDLFLCTLVTYFLLYTPKKVFTGKRIIVFRLFAALPILYEAASVTLKILASMGRIKLSPAVFPFLTTKPPVGFLVFVAFAFFIKRRERMFIRHGKTKEDYDEFLRTNANSWHFSVHAAIILAIAAVLDFVIVLVFAAARSLPFSDTEAFAGQAMEAVSLAMKWGFGESVGLIFIAPLMLLFSYTRKPKRPALDIAIPAAGVALIVAEYAEAVYYALTHLK